MATKKPTKKATAKKKQPLDKKAAAPVNDGPRVRNLTRRQRVKREKGIQKEQKLLSSWKILGRSLQHLYRHKKLFLGILAVYGVLYLLLVKGVSGNFQLGNLRESLTEAFGGELGTLGTGVALYGLLLGSAGTNSGEAAGVYQTILIVIASLALIWALRQTYAGAATIRIRDSFYKSMYPLVQFTLVGLVILVQFLPALIVSSLYTVVQSNGIQVGGIEQAIAITIMIIGMLMSLYFISSSLFALYIVTLPDTAPRQALRAAKKLVRFRRAAIIRRVLFLPIILLLFSAVVLIPLIIFLAPAAEVLFIVSTILVLGVVHSYFYTLYRSLL